MISTMTVARMITLEKSQLASGGITDCKVTLCRTLLHGPQLVIKQNPNAPTDSKQENAVEPPVRTTPDTYSCFVAPLPAEQ
jgi:ABC-type protease/lipase transport system fused ATPase/permease subunit